MADRRRVIPHLAGAGRRTLPGRVSCNLDGRCPSGEPSKSGALMPDRIASVPCSRCARYGAFFLALVVARAHPTDRVENAGNTNIAAPRSARSVARSGPGRRFRYCLSGMAMSTTGSLKSSCLSREKLPIRIAVPAS